MKFDFEGEKNKMAEEASQGIVQRAEAELRVSTEVQQLSEGINKYAASHGIEVQITRKELTLTLGQGQRTFIIKTLSPGRYNIQIGANRPAEISGEQKLMREIIQWLKRP